MRQVGKVLRELLHDETGQDLIEYAVVAGLIGIGAVISLTNFTTKIKNAFGNVGNALTNAT